MKKILARLILWLVFAGGNLCNGQTNSQSISTWGQSVQGVRLAISMTNNVFRLGTSAGVIAVTKNSSTNAIIVDESAPTMNFDVLLTNDTGKSYHVTTRKMIRSPKKLVSLGFGEESEETVPVTFIEDIAPGDYTLKAVRKFVQNNKNYTLESNAINVSILK